MSPFFSYRLEVGEIKESMALIAESAGLRGSDDWWEGFVFQFHIQSDCRSMSLSVT